MTIDEMIDRTIGLEGGYSNHPSDRGGPTKWGITERVARRNGYSGDMRHLPREDAVRIYREEYAVRPGFVAVAEIWPRVGEELFDTGVNTGPGRPSEWLQRCLNALNRRGRDYADIKVDGDIGGITIGALKAYKAKRGSRGEIVLLRALNSLQGEFYIRISEGREKNEDFTFGWFDNRVVIE